MTTANKITFFRIILIPVFMLFFFVQKEWSYYTACVVFIVASVTDFLDGYIARKYDQVTDFGKFADPLADKLLVAAAFIGFVDASLTPAWMVTVIIARELIVTALRTVAAASGRVIAASYFGKVKTTVQMVVIIYLLIFGWRHLCIGPVSVNLVLNVIVLVITVASGVDYLYKNRALLKMVK
ncbi:MAG: CDP-diacylglycerol--glycerol-3-phosphate 3-phosphatidyltransferase [Clostridia bacterium]|nr:CDP-diacylglycerol--glycerol-3-phosphate 3-phosphatidyltransferase [Clostridia bacterium]